MPADNTEFVIRPNSTFHPRTWIWLFILLVVVSLSIAIRFALLGYWMILPFALLDMLAVGIMLWLVTRTKSYVEKIVISEGSVEIFHIQRNRDSHWEFPRYFSQIKLEPPAHQWYPSRLLIGCKGQWIEIGGCLTGTEKQSLAEAIAEVLNR